jgi:TRAP-type C4-dicarboxylate transport system permease small subunit
MTESKNALRHLGLIVGIVTISAFPLIVAILALTNKSVRLLLAQSLSYVFLFVAIWAGYRWYKLFYLDRASATDNGMINRKVRGFFLALAVLFGIGVYALMFVTVSHEMVRALTEVRNDSDDAN